MHKMKLLSSGAWLLALLVGLYAWLSPDFPFYPRPIVGMVAGGAGLLLLFAWAIAVGFQRDEPRPTFVAHLGAITPLLAAVVALFLAGQGILPYAEFPILFIIGAGLAGAQVGKKSRSAPMGRGAEFGVAMLMILTLWVIIPALLLATLGDKVWQVVDIDYRRPVARIESTRILDRYRPEVWTFVTFDDAGMALHSISQSGGGTLGPHLLPPANAVARPWLPDTGPFAHWSADSVLRFAQGGLKGAERAWLTQIGGSPGLAMVDSVGHAAGADPWAALRVPVAEGVTWPELPLIGTLGLRDAARAKLYGAVVPAISGRQRAADSVYRVVIGYGLRLRDDSDALLGSLIGANIMREAGLMMAVQWRGEGKVLLADSLSAALTGGAWGPRDSTAPPPAPLTRDLVLAAARDTTKFRFERWERLSQLGLAPCTNLREMLFGPTSTVRQVYADAAGMAKRSPQEQAAFAVLTRGVEGQGGAGGLPFIFKPVGWVLGPRAGECGRVLMLGVM